MTNNLKHMLLPFLSLFTSVGTLLCCALPALLVTLGMGAALAGLISAAPWIGVISTYKTGLFIVAGIFLVGAGIMQWRARHVPCPADPAQAKVCRRLRMMSRSILGFSAVIYCVGVFFAFFAAELLL